MEKKEKQDRSYLKTESNIKNWKFDHENKLIIKKEDVLQFVKYMHKYSGHPGELVLYYNLKKYYSCRNLAKLCKQVVYECMLCKINKKSATRVGRTSIQTTVRFKKIGADIFGPFSLSNFINENERDKGYFFCITDLHTRFSQVYFTTNPTENFVISKLEEWIKKYEKPDKILTDNGTQFTSKTFEKFLITNNIEAIRTPVYHPASNGTVERQNSMIAEMIRIYRGQSIEEVTEKINKRLNINYKRSIKTSPYEMIHGYSFFDPLRRESRIILKTENSNTMTHTKPKFAINEIVYIRDTTASKTEDQYKGPFVISEVGDKGLWIKVHNKRDWYHVKNVKKGG